MTAILLSSTVALLLACTAFFTYEFVSFRRSALQQIATLGKIVATNSAAALAFQNQKDATSILAALEAEPHIVAAALYDADGKLFANYPAGISAAVLPDAPGSDGFRFGPGRLSGFQPVAHGANRRLGTLYLESDLEAMYERFHLYGSIVMLIIGVSLFAAYAVSRRLQLQISEPILALADAARTVSERSDYSVRVVKRDEDEVGKLTDAFNRMIAQIQDQNSSLKESEKRHRILFETSPLPIWVYDCATLRFLTVNAAAISFYGYSQEEFFAMTIKDIRPPEEVPALLDEIAQQPSTDRFRSPRNWTHRKKDGSTAVMELTSHDLVLDGRPARLVLANDVTARVRAEAEICDLNEGLERRIRARTGELEDANRELESFSYSVSHDLRAPLRHIEGFVHLVTKHAGAALDDRSRRYLNTVTETVGEMGKLIDDLLDFSRMGRVEMRRSEVNLDEIVDEVLAGLASEVQGRDIEWTRHPLPVVQGDARLLKQVFVNLVANAVKYSRPRKPAKIEIGTSSEPEGELVFMVRDNGVGFDMKYADKLFGVFQRLHHADEFEGTGIGLANVRRIVMRHGGRIWAEGALDRGATIWFTLPRAKSS